MNKMNELVEKWNRVANAIEAVIEAGNAAVRQQKKRHAQLAEMTNAGAMTLSETVAELKRIDEARKRRRDEPGDYAI